MHLLFVSLRSAEMAIERVAERVRRGGHVIPPPEIRRRYRRHKQSKSLRDNALEYGPVLHELGNCSGQRWKLGNTRAGISSRRRRLNLGGEAGGGLGLGFFIAKTLLERSGARLDFENRAFPDRGAVVRVRWNRGDFEQRIAFAS